MSWLRQKCFKIYEKTTRWADVTNAEKKVIAEKKALKHQNEEAEEKAEGEEDTKNNETAEKAETPEKKEDGDDKKKGDDDSESDEDAPKRYMFSLGKELYREHYNKYAVAVLTKFKKKHLEWKTGKKEVVMSTQGGEYTFMNKMGNYLKKGSKYILFAGIFYRIVWPVIQPKVLELYNQYTQAKPETEMQQAE